MSCFSIQEWTTFNEVSFIESIKKRKILDGYERGLEKRIRWAGIDKLEIIAAVARQRWRLAKGKNKEKNNDK